MKKLFLGVVLVVILVVGLSAIVVAEETFFTVDNSPYHTTVSIAQSRSITLQSPDGRAATVDFSGEEITYSGELPVADSAKLFFEAFASLFDKRCKQLNGGGDK